MKTGKQSLHIVHLAKYYPPSPGGMETHIACLARQLTQKGARVSVVCINDRDGVSGASATGFFGPTAPSRENDAGVEVLRVGRWLSFGSVDMPRGLMASIREALRSEPDVVHLHTPNPVMTVALRRAGAMVPLVITHHSDVIRQRTLRKVFAPLEHWVYRQAGAIITTSPVYSSGSQLLKDFKEKVRCVPLGIDLAPFLAPSPEAVLEEGRMRRSLPGPIWLVVGRLVYYKGVEVAIRALTGLAGTLIIVGTGPLREKLSRLAEKEGLAARVRFLGNVTPATLAGAYRAATALLFPSCARSEAFGLVQVEAMASGCPVINASIAGSGVPWVSRDGDTGLTVPTDDPMALAEAANRLLADPALRERLGQRGRARALAEFEEGHMADLTLAVYEQIGSRRKPE
ncbi:MAG: glycosyltransferase [Thermoanaerobaculia bacterium]